jgi:outer membrane receptor protein involved in Fe transport
LKRHLQCLTAAAHEGSMERPECGTSLTELSLVCLYRAHNKELIMNSLVRFALIVAVVAPWFATPLLLGQDTTGKVIGTVLDPQNAVVREAKVEVKNVGTGMVNTTTTDQDGKFQVLNLPIGSYNVTVEKQGFQKTVTKPYPMEINQSLRIDVTLAVGTTSQTVEVSGTAAQVETYNATLGASVTSRPLEDMPLNGRNILDLARLEPGVTDQNEENGAAGNFSIAGGRTDSVTYLLDGGSNNDLLNNGVVFDPNPDTVAEFRILESNYGAEYGRNAGGVISIVTKSGTNNYHGTAFDFIRNDALDANRYFNKRQNPIEPGDTLKRHQFGGTFGGPVGFPGVFLAKDRAFFFVGYQGQRETLTDRPTTTIVNAFTPAEINGDFSQSTYASTVASFLTANSYFQPNPALAAQGIIDPTRIDSVAKSYIAAGIIPVSSSGTLHPTAPFKDNSEELIGKIDYNFTPSDRLSFTLGWNKDSQVLPFAGSAATPFPVQTVRKYWFLNAAYTKNFSTNLLNEFRATGQRRNTLQSKPLTHLPGPAELGIAVIPDQVTGPPILNFYGSNINLGFSYGGPTILIGNTFSFSDTLTWVRGRHNMKIGFQFAPYQNNTTYDYYVDGSFGYYGPDTSTGSGYDFADFLMGLPDEYYQAPKAPTNIRTKSYYGFAQDEWKVTKNLVLNFGLRYEYSTPKLDTLGRTFSILPGHQSQVFVNAPLGLVFPGDPGAPGGVNFPDRNDFAPRFGFAWDPKGNGRTSIRGGIGMFYDVLKGEDNLQFNGQVPFFSTSDLFFNSPPDGYVSAPNIHSDPFNAAGVTNPFPSKPPDRNIDFDAAGFLPFGGSSVYAVDPHLRTPYTFHYNLSVQRDLGRGFAAEVSYVGSASHKLTGLKDGNPMILGSDVRVLNAQPNVQYDYSFSYLDTFENVGNEIYSSLQTSLKKQMTENKYFGSSYFTLAYTWSHNIDNSSGFREWSSNVPVGNPNLLRGSSDLDIRHNFSLGGGWDLPFHNFWPSAPKRLTKGWSLYPIVTVRTGFPMDMRYFLSRRRTRPGPSGYGDSQLVGPNVTGRVAFFNPRKTLASDGVGAMWFDTSVFETDSLVNANDGSIPAPGDRTYGSYARNSLRGPGRTNVDMSFAKITNITEHVNLELRADFFNFFNHAQFYKPGLNPLQSNFGEITDTYDPRIIQVAGKIRF